MINHLFLVLFLYYGGAYTCEKKHALTIIFVALLIVVGLFCGELFNIFIYKIVSVFFLNLVNNVQLRGVIFLYFCLFERVFGLCFGLCFDFSCSRLRGHRSRIL